MTTWNRFFPDGQLADIANVILDSGELCLDLGIVFGVGFGSHVSALRLLESGSQSVEMAWTGGQYISIIMDRQCRYIEVHEHLDCT